MRHCREYADTPALLGDRDGFLGLPRMGIAQVFFGLASFVGSIFRRR